jgi:hypothetical protein
LFRAGVLLAVVGVALLAAPAMPSPALSNSAQLAPRARFACYPAQFSAFKPRTQTLTDQLRAKLTLSVDSPDTVCAPAPGKSSGYLTCYRATINSTNLPSATVHGSDEFGPIDARVYTKGMTLCVPSTRIDTTPGSMAKELDPFTCYPSGHASVGRTGVIVADEFGSAADTITARGALRTCCDQWWRPNQWWWPWPIRPHSRPQLLQRQLGGQRHLNDHEGPVRAAESRTRRS